MEHLPYPVIFITAGPAANRIVLLIAMRWQLDPNRRRNALPVIKTPIAQVSL